MKDKIIYIIFAIIGVGLLLGTGYWINQEREFVSRAQKSKGTVIELVKHTSSGKSRSVTYAPKVRFTLPDGSVHEFVSTMSSSKSSYAVGQPVNVLFDPAKPDTAEIDSMFVIWFGPGILGFLGLVFSGIGIGSLAMILKRRSYCKYLLQSGIKIPATGGKVERDCSMRINGQCAWRIVCEADYNGERRVFKSDRLWKDPTEKVRDRQVTIAIDPSNPKKYCVDLSFMA